MELGTAGLAATTTRSVLHPTQRGAGRTEEEGRGGRRRSKQGGRQRNACCCPRLSTCGLSNLRPRRPSTPRPRSRSIRRIGHVVTWRGVIGRVNARGTQAPVWVDGNGKATRLPQAARGRCDPPAPAGQRAGKIRIFLAERGRRGSGNRWKLKRDDGGDNRPSSASGGIREKA